MSEDKIGWLSRELAVPEVALAVYDSAGPGQVILFLHGLGGYALECSAVASRLGNEHRVVSLDQRGHGSSTTRPDDLSRAAFVSDAVAVIENLDVGPVMVVGQSFGAHTALLLAASRPELVSALILVEGGVGGGGQEATNEVIDWFASWPTPFADTTAAATYFGGGRAGEAWAAGLAPSATGLVPRFELEVLREAIHAVNAEARWADWAAISTPTLLVKGQRGFLEQAEADEMLASNPMAAMIVIDGAGHDVHLDSSEQLAAAISTFVGEIESRTT
ncbi:alpha/beta hydrolase [Verrucosispora sp. WMMD1129]|uniref:alpha/beta fold hydrolase n=1 Tax=Verrucosispora sp. WMMD1129 TaxID=3016093 RepID=UPI00249B2549|nr:alpha/beta hydrolase [Verrucosispora sp. WMMD1129]WFE47724.1 alpha/beta hydrolase [Verrucosispora sp. WMMD1129]